MTALLKIPPYDYSNRLQREYRQPQGIADFVLIDPLYYQNYPSMVRLYDKLPTGLPMAKDKAEPSNRYYSKLQVADFSHFSPNHKKHIHCLVIDVDQQDGQWNFMQWAEVGLPPPNIIICNPDKPNSVQYIYLLKYPVRPHHSPHTKSYLDSIYVCMRDLLNGDKHFARTRSKNPFHASHDVYVSGAEPYDLTTLADKADLHYQPAKPSYRPLTLDIEPLEPNNGPKFHDKAFPDSDYHRHGRNGETFFANKGKGYANAYLCPTDLYDYVFNECRQYQKRFDTPLSDRECGDIARSITKYCIEHFGTGTGERNPNFARTGKYSPSAKARFSIKQRNRVVKGRWSDYKDKKAQAQEMLKNGVKQVTICKDLGIAKSTLHEWKKSFKIS